MLSVNGSFINPANAEVDTVLFARVQTNSPQTLDSLSEILPSAPEAQNGEYIIELYVAKKDAS